MPTTIHLEPAQVPAHLRAGYEGRKLKAEICERMTIPASAGLWDAGTRDVFTLIRLSDGQSIDAPGQAASPWDARHDRPVTLQPGFAVVRHSTFQSRDMGLTFYVHPSDAAAMLPAPADLTKAESLVLQATASFKASYGGRDRFDMMREESRYGDDFASFPTRADWDAAKASLVVRGYLNKAGAITPAGRNACPGR